MTMALAGITIQRASLASSRATRATTGRLLAEHPTTAWRSVRGRDFRLKARTPREDVATSTSTSTSTVSVWGGMEISKPLLTTYLPAAILLAILMYLDAAYSGDWSRIGVISTETERFLQTFCLFGVAIHALLGVAAAKISMDRGERNWWVRGLKTFVVGVTSFTEVYFLPEESSSSSS